MKKRTLYFMILAIMSLACFNGCVNQQETEVVVSKNDEDPTSENNEDVVPIKHETSFKEEQTDINIETASDQDNNALITSENGEEEQIDLSAEIQAINEEAKKLNDQTGQYAYDDSMRYKLCDQEYKLWDDELNSLWKRFCESAPEDLKDAVLKEQRIWIKDKEIEAKCAGLTDQGGALQRLNEREMATRLTRMRCYELAQYLAEVTDQKFDLEVPKSVNITFIDDQGTSDIYSELIIEKVDRKNYAVTIGIYRLATFKGKATMISEGTYAFEDEERGIKGTIYVNEDHLGANFEITASDWQLVKVGDVFQFPGRLF